MIKNWSLCLLTLVCTGVTCGSVFADIAIDFREGRTNAIPTSVSDPATTLSTFQTADANLDSSTLVIINVGLNPINDGDSANNGTSWNDLNTAQTFGDYTIATTGAAGGFSAGGASWNNNAPVSETYAFADDDEETGIIGTLTISGFTTAPGDMLTLTAWAVGDNFNQDSLITVNYSADAPQSATTLYAPAGNTRDDGTGSIPWVQFQSVSDGTNSISLDWAQGGSAVAAFNGFSLSITPGDAGVPGDVNCDGVVDLLDVAPFVDLILTGGFNAKADITGDGIVDLLDVAPFVALILG